MLIAQKPATENGSNLVHRHLVTCSTNVPSFTPPPPPGTPSTDGRTRSRARDLKRSNAHRAKTSHRKWFKFGTQTPLDMFYPRTEFHSPPFTRSIGSPISISPLPVFFRRGPRDPSASIASTPAVFFPATVRTNGAREKLEILQADVSCHDLPLHQIS